MWFRLGGRLGASLVLALAASTLVAVAPTGASAPASYAAERARTTNDCLRSVPERNSTRRVKICFTLFKPAGASGRDPVPLIMHSHGWGGSRTRDAAAFRRWLDAGYGVLSFDQRGFGESGGYAHVERPRFEGRDNLRLIRLVSRLRWVEQDGPGDPRLGAIGGSYGGGYQYLGAFMSLQKHGTPVYDALAPEITWHDLSESLGPQGVPRTEWALILGAGAAPTDALEPRVVEALAEGAVTGSWPDGSGPSGVDMYRYFRKNGPAWHVSRGRRLDIPALMRQGTTDTLFNLQQGFDNWQHALTPGARRSSIFVAHNGGHALPPATPPGLDPSGDPCSAQLAGSWATLSLRFMDEQLRGRDRGLTGYGDHHLATPADTCTTVSSVEPRAAYDVGTVATPSGAPAWLAHPVAEGPVSIAGSAHLTGLLTTLGVGTHRAYYGLAIGSSPLDARLVQNNVYPLSVEGPVSGEETTVELPAVAVDVPEGQSLYLIASGVSETFVGTSGRTPGVVTLDETVVHLPVVPGAGR